MSESECAAYKELKDREDRAHTAWTSFLYRNEIKPKPSDRAIRKQQKEKMDSYEQAHKARLSHAKTCPTCLSNSDKSWVRRPDGDARRSTSLIN